MTHDEGPDDPGCAYFDEFLSALEARAAYTLATEAELVETKRGIYFYQPFWALLCDLEPRKIFDSAGVIHTGQGATELMPLNEQVDFKLAFTSGVHGPYLPQGSPTVHCALRQLTQS